MALSLSQEVLPHGRLRQPLCSDGGELPAARLLRIIAMCTFTQVTLPSDGPRKCCLLVCSSGKLGKMSREQQPTGCAPQPGGQREGEGIEKANGGVELEFLLRRQGPESESICFPAFRCTIYGGTALGTSNKRQFLSLLL